MSNIFLLSKKEADNIKSWINNNNYSIYKGYFVLRFKLKSTGISSIEFDYIANSNTSDCLVVFDNNTSRDINNLDVNVLQVEYITVELNTQQILDEYKKWISNISVNTNEDSAQQFFTVEYKISKFGYGIYIDGNLKDEIPMAFDNLSADENKKLLNGISIIEVENDPNVPYFSLEDIAKIVNRAADMGLDVYGIECWTSVDFTYFKTYVEELYTYDTNTPKEEWAKKALKQLMDEYNEVVLKKESNNPPIFNLSVGKE